MAISNRLEATKAADIIFPAVDVDTLDAAKRLMDTFVGLVSHVKLGLQLATRESWSTAIEAAHERELKIFCDAKFKDIPNTVEHASYSLTAYQPEFFTIMADNSLAALEGARRGVDQAATDFSLRVKPMIVGVTVLTSVNDEESRIIYGDKPEVKTRVFGQRAMECGLDALVCSPEEIGLFRAEESFDKMTIITPGVRPTWSAANDQNRITTPAEAVKRGADMLVIGRPITNPPLNIGSPKEAIKRIIDEIEEARL